MHRVARLVLLALLGASLQMHVNAAASASAGATATDAIDVIIEFRSPPGSRGDVGAVQASERSRLLRDAPDVTPRREYHRVFNGVAARVPADHVARLRTLPYVKDVIEDVPVQGTLDTTTQIIGAPDVWSDLGAEGDGVTIAIIDSGIDYSHPDLGGCLGAGCKVIGGYDFVDNDADPMDALGHGTHVAGIAAGDGPIFRGVAPGASLLAMRVLDHRNAGTSSDVIAALERIVDPDQNPATDDAADVANLSLGFRGGNPDDAVSRAVDNAVAAGVTVVVAAGNEGPESQTLRSPGTARRAITVGATDDNDDLADFSSQGPVVWDDQLLFKPDLVAPAVAICAAEWPGDPDGDACGAGYVEKSGTSMASPHVAGAATLLLDVHPDWRPAEVKAALRAAALPIGGTPLSHGAGRLRVLEATALDHAPPIAEIDTSSLQFTAPVDVVGTASSDLFDRYELQIGEGLDPSSWSKIFTGTVSVTDAVLMPGFDPALASDSGTTLRLLVFDTLGLVSEYRSFFVADHLRISNLRNSDVVRGGIVEIRGSIDLPAATFEGYDLQWGAGSDPSAWSSAGITLPSGGALSVPSPDVTLAFWDTTALAAGTYTLRLTARDSLGDKLEFVRGLRFDATLREGWPQHVPFNQNSATAGIMEPAVGDLDGDGTHEVVVFRAGSSLDVLAFAADGALLWTSSLQGDDVGQESLHHPLLVDLDRDGNDEVLVHHPFGGPGSLSAIYALDGDGSVRSGWPITLPRDHLRTLAAADLDLDGWPEIIAVGKRPAGGPRYVHVINADGSIRAQWTAINSRDIGSGERALAPAEGTPAVGNFDADPELEIVVASINEGMSDWLDHAAIVHVYNIDGTVVPGWPVSLPGVPFSSPAVADLDGDGRSDLVIGLKWVEFQESYGRLPGGIYALNADGDVIDGWPLNLTPEPLQTYSSPALGNLDADSDLEIAITAYSRGGFGVPIALTYVLNPDGTTLPGWPQPLGGIERYSNVLGDVDGDGALDVITTNATNDTGVIAWTAHGELIATFPKPSDRGAIAPPVVADLDADGVSEIITTSSADYDDFNRRSKRSASIYVWKTDAPAVPSPWPQFHGNSALTGSYPDTDLDGCTDGEEATPNPQRGGDRDPHDYWDFYDVTADRSVDLRDVLGVLARFGQIPSTPGYQARFDRHVPDPLRPHRTARAGDGVTLVDALAVLAQYGHACSALP